MKIKGKKLTYIRERRRLPNGVVTNLEMIEHPGAALIVPFLSKDKVIFLRQYRAVLRRYLYELPAGTLSRRETPLACARRELPEEAGYAAGCFTYLGKIHPVPGYSTEVIHIFKAEKLAPQKAQKDFDEIIRAVVLSRRQIRQLFNQHKIVDAKTICALAMARII
jgi:ADP-ribose pyrophosphatase